MNNKKLSNSKAVPNLPLLEEISEQEAEQIRGGESWGWEGNGGEAIREMNDKSASRTLFWYFWNDSYHTF